MRATAPCANLLQRVSAELCVFRLCGRSHLNRDYAALRRANLVLEQQAAEYRSQLPSATPSSVRAPTINLLSSRRLLSRNGFAQPRILGWQVQRAASYVSSSNGMLWGTLDPRCVEFESVREQLAGPLGAVGESSCAPNTQPVVASGLSS